MGPRYVVVCLIIVVATTMTALLGCSSLNPSPAPTPTFPSLAPGETFVPPRPSGTSVVDSTTPVPLAENKPRLVIRDFVQDTDEQRWTLKNVGDAPANLKDWQIVTGAKVINRKPLPDDIVLAPNQELVIHTKAGQNSQTDFYLGFEGPLSVQYWVPGDPLGGQIEIRTRDDSHAVSYPIPRPKTQDK